jgi:large subunit ribosomal protein L17
MAKSLTKLLAKLVGWAKRGDLHSRRLALKYLVNKKHQGVLQKLFTDLGERYKDRKGGYSRIIKNKPRIGDNSIRVVFSLT